MPNTVAPYRHVSLSHEFDGYTRRGIIDQAFFEHYLPTKKKWARPAVSASAGRAQPPTSAIWALA